MWRAVQWCVLSTTAQDSTEIAYDSTKTAPNSTDTADEGTEMDYDSTDTALNSTETDYNGTNTACSNCLCRQQHCNRPQSTGSWLTAHCDSARAGHSDYTYSGCGLRPVAAVLDIRDGEPLQLWCGACNRVGGSVQDPVTDRDYSLVLVCAQGRYLLSFGHIEQQLSTPVVVRVGL